MFQSTIYSFNAVSILLRVYLQNTRQHCVQMKIMDVNRDDTQDIGDVEYLMRVDVESNAFATEPALKLDLLNRITL